MKNLKIKEKYLLQIIRYLPIVFIIILSFLVTLYISYDNSKDLIQNKQILKKEFIDSNNKKIEDYINTINNYIDKKLLKSKEQLKTNIKHHTQSAYKIMYTIYDEHKDTKSKDEITKIIKSALKSIRFNQNRGYFFIYDLNGTNILHPTKPKREGKNFFNAKDITGTFIVQESINIAKSKNKEGFQNWFFNKPNEISKEFEKIGFIKKFEPYNWYIGTGEYLDDFKNEIKKQSLEYIKSIEFQNNEYVFILQNDNTNLFYEENNLQNNNWSTFGKTKI